MTPKVLWEVVKEAASRAGIQKLAPHDLRRTCARLCHLASGELDQIQFLGTATPTVRLWFFTLGPPDLQPKRKLRKCTRRPPKPPLGRIL